MFLTMNGIFIISASLLAVPVLLLAASLLHAFLLRKKEAARLDALRRAEEAEERRREEHALIKALADKITFMEMTLLKMDPSVRGYRQLAKSVSQMKDNLLANGYELVDMLGKPYHEGMKVTANFVGDDTLEPGQQLITGIIKPQINFQGRMIQAAQITVSQNIE